MPYFFVPDRKSFYYRSHVPRPLRRLLKGRREVWRSLFCTDKDLAKLRAASWDRRTLQLYMTLRKQGERITEEQREALVSQWLDAELEYAEDERATAGKISEAKREGQQEGLIEMQYQAVEDLLEGQKTSKRIRGLRHVRAPHLPGGCWRHCRIGSLSCEKDMPVPFTTTLSELNRLYGEYYDATSRSKNEAETAWIVYLQYLKRYMQERGMAVVDEEPPKS